MKQHKRVRPIRWWWILFLIIGVILAAAGILSVPWNIPRLTSHPNPAQDYAEAIRRVGNLQAEEPADMNPVCRVQLMTHAEKVERAIIFVHGYTNCPQQFRDLGQHFYDLGYNVLIAPLPYHGLADRMTKAHARLTAEDLAAYADEVVDIAQGLGEQVFMMGISGGGTITAWAAQNRPDLAMAVIIAPAFGYKQIPTPLTAAVMNIYTYLPDAFVWWNPTLQADAPPPQGYPRYSQHALVQFLRLGYTVQAQARRSPPAAKQILIVYNANDSAVNNALTAKVVKTWQAKHANLSTYEFEAGLKLGHDLIDPTDLSQKVDIVYPRLIALVNP